MVGFISVALAAWEAFAFATKRPTVTTLSTRGPQGFLVWAWLGWLALHFIDARRHGH